MQRTRTCSSAREVLAKAAGILAKIAGVSGIDLEHDDQPAKNRREAVGALLEYTTGITTGIVYGFSRTWLGNRSNVLSGFALGLVAMAAGDAPIAATGVFDPRTWSISAWASDAIPHVIYGMVTILVH